MFWVCKCRHLVDRSEADTFKRRRAVELKHGRICPEPQASGRGQLKRVVNLTGSKSPNTEVLDPKYYTHDGVWGHFTMMP